MSFTHSASTESEQRQRQKLSENVRACHNQHNMRHSCHSTSLLPSLTSRGLSYFCCLFASRLHLIFDTDDFILIHLITSIHSVFTVFCHFLAFISIEWNMWVVCLLWLHAIKAIWTELREWERQSVLFLFNRVWLYIQTVVELQATCVTELRASICNVFTSTMTWELPLRQLRQHLVCTIQELLQKPSQTGSCAVQVSSLLLSALTTGRPMSEIVVWTDISYRQQTAGFILLFNSHLFECTDTEVWWRHPESRCCDIRPPVSLDNTTSCRKEPYRLKPSSLCKTCITNMSYIQHVWDAEQQHHRPGQRQTTVCAALHETNSSHTMHWSINNCDQ